MTRKQPLKAKSVGMGATIALIASLACVPLSSGAAEQEASGPEQFLPANTTFYLKVGTWKSWATGMDGTCLCKILQEPEVQAFLAGPLARFRKAGSDAAPADKGDQKNGLGSAIPGPIVFAVFNPEGEAAKNRPLDLALIIGTKGLNTYFVQTLQEATKLLPEFVRDLVEFVVFKLTQKGALQEKYQNADLSIVKIGPYSITLTITGDHLILTTDQELCKRVIDGMAGTLPNKLIDMPGYKACQLSGQEQLSAYLDLKNIQNLFGLKLPLDKEGILSDLKAVAWSVRTDGAAFESKTGFILQNPQNGLLGALESQPISPAALKNCPSGSPIVAGLRVKSAEIWSILRRISTTGGGEKSAQRWEAMEQKWAADQRDLKREFAAAFSGDFIITTHNAPGGSLFSQMAVLTLTDKAKAEKLLTDLMKDAITREYPNADPTTVLQVTDFEGARIVYLRGPEGGGAMQSKYAITSEALLWSMDMQTLKGAIKAIKTSNLANSKNFTEAVDRSGGKIGSVFMFVDWSLMYQSAFDMGAQAMKILGSTEVFRKLGIDVNLLPSPDVVTKHLFSSMAVLERTENGVVLSSRSPLPSVEVLAPPISAIASVIAAFTSGESKPVTKAESEPKKGQ